MILNVSGRTDVVAFYSKWFMNRYKEGYIDVRNPFNRKFISRINFKDVDAILFCTKNPIPILNYLKDIKKPILFQITLTPYKQDIEPNVPAKKKIIEAIKKLSIMIGIDNVYIRYDPILLNDKYNVEYHKKAFHKMCTLLDGYVKHIIVSFVDDYKNVRKNGKMMNLKEFTKEDYKEIGIFFSTIANKHNITVQTCGEKENLVEYGFRKEDCLSHTLAFQLTGKTNFKNWKARKNKNCNCVEMVDIGVYNSCRHFCKYCYANYEETEVMKNYQKHNENSSLLVGEIEKGDVIKVRKS